jgi:hypothetical protein
MAGPSFWNGARAAGARHDSPERELTTKYTKHTNKKNFVYFVVKKFLPGGRDARR